MLRKRLEISKGVNGSTVWYSVLLQELFSQSSEIQALDHFISSYFGQQKAFEKKIITTFIFDAVAKHRHKQKSRKKKNLCYCLLVAGYIISVDILFWCHIVYIEPVSYPYFSDILSWSGFSFKAKITRESQADSSFLYLQNIKGHKTFYSKFMDLTAHTVYNWLLSSGWGSIWRLFLYAFVQVSIAGTTAAGDANMHWSVSYHTEKYSGERVISQAHHKPSDYSLVWRYPIITGYMPS